jgi:hypothetical protein
MTSHIIGFYDSHHNTGIPTYINPFHSRGIPGVFYTYFYNGYFKPLLGPGGGFRSEMAVT